MNGIVNELANENACHSEVTWNLDRWIPGTGMFMNNDQECTGGSKGCVALLLGTVLINLMIVGTQDW